MTDIGFGRGQRPPTTPEEMRAHAANLHRRADAITSKAWDRLTSVPSPVVAGGSNYTKTFGRKNARNLAGMERAHEEAKALREAAGKWLYRADRDDPVKIAARAKNAETKATVRATIQDFMRDTIKPGDTVFVWTGNPISVKRVNKVSITCDSGTSWKFDEITTHLEPADMIAAFNKWMRGDN